MPPEAVTPKRRVCATAESLVGEETNGRYYRLIDAFGRATGVPVVLNTSFNLRGEPIVNTPAEAFNTFMASGMDTLVLGEHVIDKREITGASALRTGDTR